MPHRPALAPHLDFEEEEILEPYIPGKPHAKFGLQGPSKYGAGGRRVYKAKGRKGSR